MKKIRLIFIMFCFLSGFALADIFNNPADFETITKKIPKMGNIKCSFRQEKTLQNISKPIVSKGNFEFIEGKGVYFYTKYPVESVTDYTNKKYKQINSIVSAISSKKYSKLEKEFNFYFEEKDKNWTLGMKPKKNSDSYNYIKSIIINGSDYINKIDINQTNGNSTVIWFAK